MSRLRRFLNADGRDFGRSARLFLGLGLLFGTLMPFLMYQMSLSGMDRMEQGVLDDLERVRQKRASAPAKP